MNDDLATWFAEIQQRLTRQGYPAPTAAETERRLLFGVLRATYLVDPNPAPHTCWHRDDWAGILMPEVCAGCAQAVQHPCHYCGYGTVFATHAPESHYDAGDPTVSDDEGYELPMSDPWAVAPHFYDDHGLTGNA